MVSNGAEPGNNGSSCAWKMVIVKKAQIGSRWPLIRDGEEIANSITHGVGAVLSLAALVVIVLRGTRPDIVAFAVYGASLVMLYCCSAIYHALENGRAKRVFRILDHSAIYVLIAGTYTPFTLITLRGAWGWSLFGVVWTLAVLGIVFKCYFTGRLHALSTTIYILMGWLAVVAVRPLLQALPLRGVLWILAGGIFYTGGVAFFAGHRKYWHSIWHVMVLAGSACHFVAVYWYVMFRPV